MWTCPKCGTKVDPSFDVCWQCGTTAEGVEDPGFVAADEAGPIEDTPGDRDPSALPDGLVLPAIEGAGADEIVACYQALSLMEAQFLANELVQQGIPAVSDTIDMQDALGAWTGNPHVYCRTQDLARARAWLADYETHHKPRLEHGDRP